MKLINYKLRYKKSSFTEFVKVTSTWQAGVTEVQTPNIHIPEKKETLLIFLYRRTPQWSSLSQWWNEKGIPLCTVKYIVYLLHSWMGINCQLLHGMSSWLKHQLCSRDWKRPWKWQSKTQHSKLMKQNWQERQ